MWSKILHAHTLINPPMKNSVSAPAANGAIRSKTFQKEQSRFKEMGARNFDVLRLKGPTVDEK